jgi:hypothetical protein
MKTYYNIVNEGISDKDAIAKLKDILGSGDASPAQIAQVLRVLAARANNSQTPSTPPVPKNDGAEGKPKKPERDSNWKADPFKQESKEKLDPGDLRIAKADGVCRGVGSFNSENHIMSEEQSDELHKMNKVSKERSVKDAPYRDDAGLFGILNSIYGSRLRKELFTDGDIDASTIVDKVEQRIRNNHKSKMNWLKELKRFFKHKSGKLVKTLEKTRTILGGKDDPYSRRLEFKGDSGNKLVIFLDTSGSVLGSPDVLEQFIAEIQSIAKKCELKTVDLILFNDCIDYNNSQRDIKVGRIKRSDWEVQVSSGGTNYPPVYNYIYDYYVKDKRVSAIMIMSDADVTWEGNRFPAWAASHKARGEKIEKKLGKKTLFFALDDREDGVAQTYQACMPNGATVIVASYSNFVNLLNENKNTDMNYYTVLNEDDNLNVLDMPVIESAVPRRSKYGMMFEAGFKKHTPSAQPTPPAAPSPGDPEDPEEPDDNSDDPMAQFNKEMGKAIGVDRAVASRGSDDTYNLDASAWVASLFLLNKLKRETDPNTVMLHPQTYCFTPNGNVFINNEFLPMGVRRYSDKQPPEFTTSSKFTVSKVALDNCTNAPKIMRYKGDFVIQGYMGETLPAFIPRNITSNDDGDLRVGNFIIRNCPNLTSLDNAPDFVESYVKIQGDTNITPDIIAEYAEKLAQADAKLGHNVKNKVKYVP